MKNLRVCFESELSEIILNHKQYFPAVKKLTNHIIDLLQDKSNKQNIFEKDILNEKILTQLYSNTHFGTLGKETNLCLAPEKFLNEIHYALTKYNDLPTVLHIHHIFMQLIYPFLPNKFLWESTQFKEKTLSQFYFHTLSQDPKKWPVIHQEIVKELFNNELFNETIRIKKNLQGALTDKIGISQDNECLIKTKTSLHENIIGSFLPNIKSNWYKEITYQHLPFVAGPSGHTGSAMLLALLIGNFNQDEMQQYVTANIGLLTGGGYHTIHEIMAVAKKAGIKYSDGQYNFFPEKFKQCPALLELLTKYHHHSIFDRILQHAINYAKSVVSECPSYFSNPLLKNSVCFFKAEPNYKLTPLPPTHSLKYLSQ